MDAIYHAGDERFHFILIDARHLIPRNLPAFGVNHFDIGKITGAGNWRNAGVKFFKVAAPHACGGHRRPLHPRLIGTSLCVARIRTATRRHRQREGKETCRCRRRPQTRHAASATSCVLLPENGGKCQQTEFSAAPFRICRSSKRRAEDPFATLFEACIVKFSLDFRHSRQAAL
jgi:hypothetical protein